VERCARANTLPITHAAATIASEAISPHHANQLNKPSNTGVTSESRAMMPNAYGEVDDEWQVVVKQ
jgi:hypothetical protein